MSLISMSCPYGHPIKKYKKLRAWQGLVDKKKCGVCCLTLERQDFRWRCEEHCDYNVCVDCFNDHYLRIIGDAAKIDDPQRRFRMLAVVPDHLRGTEEYLAAENYQAPAEGASSKTGKGKAKKGKGSREPAPTPDDERSCARLCDCPTLCWSMKVILCAIVWVAAVLMLSWSSRALLLDKELAFPNPLLMVGLSGLVTYILCQVVASALSCCAKLGSKPDWRAAGIFGLMFCVQTCLGAKALQVSEIYYNAVPMAYSITLLLAGVVVGIEQPRPLLFVAVSLALAGGLLAASTTGAFALEPVIGTNLVIFLLFSILAGSARLAFTQKFLTQEHPSRRKPKFSPLVLATRMALPAAICSFEFAAITDFGCFEALAHVPNPQKVGALLCIIGLANAIRLVVELYLLQLTSTTFIGILVPISSVSFVILPQLLEHSRPPVKVLIAAALCLAAFAPLLCSRAWAARARSREEDDAAAYERLENGDRPRKSRSGSRRSKAREPHAMPLLGGA